MKAENAQNVFDQILDKDEQIVEVFKPNKLRMYFAGFFGMNLMMLFYLAICFLMVFVPDEATGETPSAGSTIAIFVVYAVIFVVLNGVVWLMLHLRYKKTYYAYTNKRLLVRGGVIGVDYKALDMKMVGAFDVNVSFLDKLLHKNTGTIKFGSMSSQIQTNAFFFSNITEPYENYRKIKEYIEKSKEN